MSKATEAVRYRAWRVENPKCVFLLVHGIAAHAGRWNAMAEFFMKKGVSSYAIDIPRFGRIRSYYKDIARVNGIAANDNPGKKIFLVGESLGALASFLLASECPGSFSGLVCISPAFANRKTIGLVDAIRLFVPFCCDSASGMDLPFDASMCTRDEKYRKELEDDPLGYHSISVRSAIDILSAQACAPRAAGKINMSVLFLVAGEDKIADPAASRKIFDILRSQDKSYVEFPGMYHSLSIEADREKVFEVLDKWAGQHI